MKKASLNSSSDILQRMAQLSPEKRELLRLLLREKVLASRLSELKGMPDLYPLSISQEYFIDKKQAFFHEIASTLTYSININGPLNIELMEGSMNTILKRHEVLRTNFIEINGEYYQKISSFKPISPKIVEINKASQETIKKTINERAHKLNNEPFDLENGSLFRYQLFRINDEYHVLILNLHHLICDGWSLAVFVSELGILYSDALSRRTSELPELPFQFVDFALWQNQMFQGDKLESIAQYCRKKFSDQFFLNIPTKIPRKDVRSLSAKSLTFHFPPNLFNSVKEFSTNSGTTLYVTLLSAFKILLFVYSGQTNMLVNSIASGRDRAEVQNLIGCFVNNLLIKSDLSENPDITDILSRVHAGHIDAYNNQEIPYSILVEYLQLGEISSEKPFFQATFVLENFEVPELNIGDLTFGLNPFEPDEMVRELWLFIWENSLSWGDSKEPWGSFKYNTELFDESTISDMVERYLKILEIMIKSPRTRLSQLKKLV